MSTCGTPTPAVVFHSDYCSEKAEKQNLGVCRCTSLHLPAGALGVCELEQTNIITAKLSLPSIQESLSYNIPFF